MERRLAAEHPCQFIQKWTIIGRGGRGTPIHLPKVSLTKEEQANIHAIWVMRQRQRDEVRGKVISPERLKLVHFPQCNRGLGRVGGVRGLKKEGKRVVLQRKEYAKKKKLVRVLTKPSVIARGRQNGGRWWRLKKDQRHSL